MKIDGDPDMNLVNAIVAALSKLPLSSIPGYPEVKGWPILYKQGTYTVYEWDVGILRNIDNINKVKNFLSATMKQIINVAK